MVHTIAHASGKFTLRIFTSTMLLVFRFSDIVVVRLNLHILLSGKYLIHSAEAKFAKILPFYSLVSVV
jgi:hypothetical protein